MKLYFFVFATFFFNTHVLAMQADPSCGIFNSNISAGTASTMAWRHSLASSTKRTPNGFERGVRTGLQESISELAYTASLEKRSLSVMEVGQIGLDAIELANSMPSSNAMGDRLSHYVISMSPLEFKTFETPKIESTVVSEKDWISELLAPGSAIRNASSSLGQSFDLLFLKLQIILSRQDRGPILRDDKDAFERLRELRGSGVVKQEVGEPISKIRELTANGKRYDIIIGHELGLITERIEFIEAIHNSLREKGKAFLDFQYWYHVGSKMYEVFTVKDQVQLKDGKKVDLRDYLVQSFPETFFRASDSLMILNHGKALHLSRLRPEVLPEKTDEGGPVILWHVP